jgi:adenosylmethionine-8-amino-7-oxononanoate aminotransferase
MATLDYSPAFQFGHPLSFALANKLKELTPAGLDYVFFTGSGSESADTSLKMARAYWRAKGQASKTRLIGREKGYHGVNFGGQPQDFRPGHRGRPPAAHATARQRLLARHARKGRRTGRRAAQADCAARRQQYRRRYR